MLNTSFRSLGWLTVVLLAGSLVPGRTAAAGRDWVVNAVARNGTEQLPTIQAALQAAAPGDTIRVEPGLYIETLATVRGGLPGLPIRVMASGGKGSVRVMRRGRVLTVNHPHIVVEGLVLDGEYGADDTVRVGAAARDFVLRDCEVRRSSRDLVDLEGAPGTLIERCTLHHALNAAAGRTDAHGVAAGPVKDLTLRDTEIHTFSGDGLQVDPSRAAAGWTNVLLERVQFWLEPLPGPENGFAAGTVPGENGIDTKTAASGERAVLRLRDVTARGFRKGLISNMAAFNLKERVDVTADGVTVADSSIAFRIRGAPAPGGGARVTITNAVVYDVDVAVRYEDGARDLRVWHTTMGSGVRQAFRAVGTPSPEPEVRNALFLGRKPAVASHGSNLEVDETAFSNARGHDYHLAPGSPAIDRGVAIDGVYEDREGRTRRSGRAADVGAYARPLPGRSGPERPIGR